MGQRPSQRASQIRMVPRDFDDLLPADDEANPSDSLGNYPSGATETQNPPQRRIQRVLLLLRDSLQTVFNATGLCRQYPRRPSFEPDKFIPSALLAQSCPTIGAHPQRPDPSPEISEPPYLFPNITIY